MRIIGQSKPTSSILMYFLILSFLLHSLFLLSATVRWVVPPIANEKPPSMEVPAYFYRDEGKSGAAPEIAKIKNEQPQLKKAELTTKQQAESKQGSSSPNSVTVPTHEEPIHLIGDKHTPPKPLAKIIGRALAKKLTYPKIAVDFRVRGTVYVGFNIHPDGNLTEIKIVQSSTASVLDEAALLAVQSITPLQNVAAHVKQPRYLVIGIVFR